MRLIVAYGFPFVLFCVGLRCDKSKFVTGLFFVYFWILMGLNTNTPDYSSYERYYLYTSQVNVEGGFALLCNLFRYLGLTYPQFRMIFAAIYSFFTVVTAKRLTSHINYVLAMFLLMPFVINVSGIRYALAAMIVCYGIPYLISKYKNGNLKYIICVVIASTIHTSALFYLFFLFAKRRYKNFQFFLIAVAVFFGGILTRTSILLNFAIRYIPNARLIKWLSLTNSETGHLNSKGFILNVFFVVAFPILMSIITKYLLGTQKGGLIQDISEAEDLRSQKLILYKNISIYGLLTIPGYLISSEYQRFLFGVLIVYYSTFAEFKYTRLNIERSNKIIYRISSVVLVILLLALYIYSMRSHDVLGTFKDNVLFQ